jgi:outer membrane protein assembly factor BamB
LGCVKWQFETEGPVSASVTIGAHDNVHIACEDGKLYTLDPDGSLLWSCDTNSPLYSAPTVGPDGSVYVGGENGRLYAVNTDGQVRWTYSTGAFIYSSPAVSAHGKVYVGSADGILYALGPDGSELWRFDDNRSDTPASPIFASPAIGQDGTVYISRLHDANLYALDPTDGHIKWSCSFEHWIYDRSNPVETVFGWPFASPVVAPDGTIYQTLLYNPNLYAIDPNAGTILWSLDLYDPPCDNWWAPWCHELNLRDTVDGWSEPALGPDGTIYASFNDANLRAVDPNGTIKWQTKLGSGDGFTLTVADNGLIYAAGNDGWLCAIDPNGAEIARFQGRAGLNFPVVSANNTLIVSDNANTVWAIGADGCQGQQQALHRPEDPDGSGIVNLRDVALLMLDWSLCTNPDQQWWQWWQPPCDYQGEPTYLIADVDRDLYVDFRDLRMITDHWLTVDKNAFLGAQP